MLLLETDECILWEYNTNHKGYGQVYLNAKSVAVHKTALEKRFGPAPRNKPLCLHKPLVCHNRNCFNYRHLYWGNYQDNKRDQVLDGEHLIGERHGMAKLTEEDVKSTYHDARTQPEIATQYGVSRSAISGIKNHKNWRWLTCQLSPKK